MRDVTPNWTFRYVFATVLLISGVRLEPFNPSVHCHCADGRMSIIMHTDQPFKGVVYTEGHRSDCYWFGDGAQEMHLAVRLGASECGITYNQIAEDYHVILYVRQHQTIILEQDRAFNLSCSNPTSSSAAQVISDDVITAGLRILDKDGVKTHETVYGESYTLQVFLTGVSEGSNFLVRMCRAFAGDFTTKLIDEAGCSTDPSLISNMRYVEGRGLAEAAVQSMFRFPDARYVHVQCGVVRCSSYPCSKPNCERRRDDPMDRNRTRSREGLASTTLSVLEIGNMTELVFDAACSTYYSMLSWLCIVAGLSFTIVVCIHVAFCFLNGGRDVFPSYEAGLGKDPAMLVGAFTISTYSDSSKTTPIPGRYHPSACTLTSTTSSDHRRH